MSVSDIRLCRAVYFDCRRINDASRGAIACVTDKQSKRSS